MNKNNQKIPDRVKSKILEDYADAKGTVRQLSEEYGISRTSIYDWIRQESEPVSTKITKEDDNIPYGKRSSTPKSISSSSSSPSTSQPPFIEVSISHEEPPQNNLSIKEIFIDFDSFSISINSSVRDSFSKSKLLKILDIIGV